jgi:hypothetical protein
MHLTGQAAGEAVSEAVWISNEGAQSKNSCKTDRRCLQHHCLILSRVSLSLAIKQ